jgi:hypothetical protein
MSSDDDLRGQHLPESWPWDVDGIPALCFCHCMPPAPVSMWDTDPDSPTFGVTPLGMWPPPHDVLVWADDEHDPQRMGSSRVGMYVVRDSKRHDPGVLRLTPENATLLAEKLFQAAERAATDPDEA